MLFYLFHLLLILFCCILAASGLSFLIHFVLEKEPRFVVWSIYLQHSDICGFLISVLVLGGEEKLIPMG